MSWFKKLIVKLKVFHIPKINLLLFKLTPVQMILLGFVLIIVTGAYLLTIPEASRNHSSLPFLDGLFLATSGISTSGLTPVDFGGYFSLFGQLVLLVLFQIGGLGYMVIIAFIVYMVGKAPEYRNGFTIQESIAGMTWKNMKRLSKRIIYFTVIFEGLGGLLLGIEMLDKFPPIKSFYYGLFHSVSAFCTAGFGLFPDSYVSFKSNLLVNITTEILAIAGGIGFFVLNDLFEFFGRLLQYLKPSRISFRTRFEKVLHHITPWRLSLHTKIVLVTSFSIMLVTAMILLLTIDWSPSSPFEQRLLISSFQSISASTTTGYNSTNIGSLNNTSLFVLIVEMFIGVSPGGTGGGIKTTTFLVMLILTISVISRKKDSNIFYERIQEETIRKAFSISFLGIMIVLFDITLLTITEKANFIQSVFEVVSAFGNVGLSTGITSSLSAIGKAIIIMTMLIGRLGPLSVGFSITGKRKDIRFRYIEGDIFVG